MELALYGGALGLSAAFLVPLIYGFIKGLLPASVTSNVAIPTSYPTTGAGILWTVLIWGGLLGLSLWAISFIKPVGRAIESEA